MKKECRAGAPKLGNGPKAHDGTVEVDLCISLDALLVRGEKLHQAVLAPDQDAPGRGDGIVPDETLCWKQIFKISFDDATMIGRAL